MMNNSPMDEFVSMSPEGAPQGFFGNQNLQRLASCPQYGVHVWTRDQNCYIYALNWPKASKSFVFDVGDIYGAGRPDIDLSETSFLAYRMAQMKKLKGEAYRDLVRECAQLDGLIAINVAKDIDPLEIPVRAGYYLVVLYIDPDDNEHHWYRLDRTGYWSQKEGEMDPTNLDGSQELIIDPRRAERGPWKMFGGFFYVPAGGGEALYDS